MEFLNELESKIDSVLLSVQTLKDEKAKLAKELEQYKQKIQELEATQTALKNDIESTQKNTEEKQQKLDSASEKIIGLLSKLESVV